MTTRSTRRALWTVAALVVTCAAVLLTAIDAQHSSQPARARLPAGSAIVAPGDGGAAPRVAYVGPRHLRGAVTLRARVRPGGQRIVAATFMLDDRPLGTATSAPYTLDVDAALLPRGRHRLRVDVVDRLGRHSSSAPVAVHTSGTPGGIFAASPAHGLDAALAALARGHVTVRLGPGRYPVAHVEMGSGAQLVGAGSGTVLEATEPSWSLVTARGTGVRMSDLAIDGAGRAERGIGVADGSHDVRLQRLQIRGITDSGVDIWGAHSGVSVQDSTIDGGGASGAGVGDRGSDASSDSSVIRTEISGFRGWGVIFMQREYDRPHAAANALALDNRISAISDPAAADGTHEGAIWSGGVRAAIIGNQIRDIGWDGIQTVGSSRDVTVVGNDIARTMTGIYLEHETNGSLFADNVIADVVTGINSEWRYEDAGSGTNTFVGNTILRPTQTGIFIDVAGNQNRLVDNTVVGGTGPAIVLQGASDNVVAGNAACARPGQPMVVQQSAHYDNGQPANSLRNRIDTSGRRPPCPAG
jgi:parallel beta-helix repeat protein